MQTIKVLKNKTAALLLSAAFFETIGTSIYNIILLTYAKTFVHPKLFISIVSISMFIPGVFGFILGKLSDQTQHKSMSFTSMKFCQFLLYILLAIVILKKNIATFAITILINIISDCIGQYCGSLRASIIQNRIRNEDRRATLGLSSVISSLVVPLGQSIGVIILKITKAYYLAAIANALSFLISGLITLSGQKLIYYYSDTRHPSTAPQPHVDKNKVKAAIYKTTALTFMNFIICFGLINSVGASVDSVINLYFVSYTHATPFSFSISLVILNAFNIFGSILGNIINIPWLSKKSIKVLLIYGSTLITLIYLNFLLFKNFWLTVLLMFIVGFFIGFINPTIDSKLMENTDPSIMGSIWGIIGTLATVSIPFGSVGLILIYNAVSPQAMFIVAIVLMISAIILLALNIKKDIKG